MDRTLHGPRRVAAATLHLDLTVARTGLSHIGVLVGVMPRMLREVIGDIVGAERDFRVVAEDVAVDVLVQRVEHAQADVVVLSTESGDLPASCADLLQRFPRLTVVVLEERGGRASIYALRPMRVRRAELSRMQLVDAIRRLAVPTPFEESVYDVSPDFIDLAVPPK